MAYQLPLQDPAEVGALCTRYDDYLIGTVRSMWLND